MKWLMYFLVVLILGLSGFTIYYYYNHQPKADQLSYESKGPVTTPPASLTLEVGSPEEDSLLFQSTVIISGQTAPSSSVLISSEANDTVIQSTSEGSFSTVYDLQEGINNITIAVFDKNGDSRQINRTVYYTKEKI
jgi:hypothetical protein